MSRSDHNIALKEVSKRSMLRQWRRIQCQKDKKGVQRYRTKNQQNMERWEAKSPHTEAPRDKNLRVPKA